MITTFGKLAIKRNFINFIKDSYKHFTVCIRFKGEIWEFFFEIKNKAKTHFYCFILTLHSGPRLCNRVGKE